MGCISVVSVFYRSINGHRRGGDKRTKARDKA